MSLEHLDAWQARVFGLALPLEMVAEPWCVTRGRLKVAAGSTSFINDRLLGSLQGGIREDTYLVLDDGSTILLWRLWGKYRRNKLEESITGMFVSGFIEDSAKALLAPIVRRLDFTGRCLRMLQRHPEGVLVWLNGDDMKPFRVLVYEMFLEGVR